MTEFFSAMMFLTTLEKYSVLAMLHTDICSLTVTGIKSVQAEYTDPSFYLFWTYTLKSSLNLLEQRNTCRSFSMHRDALPNNRSHSALQKIVYLFERHS